jgi:hypothetical protein
MLMELTCTETPQIKNRSLVLHTLVDVFRTAENRYPGCSKNADFLVSLLSSKSAIADWLDVSAPSPFANEDSPTRTTRASRASQATQSSITLEQAALNMAACELHFAGQSMAEVAAAPYRSGQAYRELVYRASNFTEETYHGPLVVREDGEIWTDWRLLDAIARVMALNVKSAWHQWAEPEEMNILPYGFEKAVFWKQPGPGRDWAGVESKWSYICERERSIFLPAGIVLIHLPRPQMPSSTTTTFSPSERSVRIPSMELS